LYSGTGTAVPATATTTCATTSDGSTLFDTGATFNGLGALMANLGTTDVRCASGTGKPSDGAAWAFVAKTNGGAWCVDSAGWSSDKYKSTGAVYTTTLLALPATAVACA